MRRKRWESFGRIGVRGVLVMKERTEVRGERVCRELLKKNGGAW
jgi:hypothetical protein